MEIISTDDASVLYNLYRLFYQNIFYTNVETEIFEILRIKLRLKFDGFVC